MNQTPGVSFSCKSKAFINLIHEESLFIFKEKEQKFLWMEMSQAAILMLFLFHSFLSPINVRTAPNFRKPQKCVCIHSKGQSKHRPTINLFF